MIALIIISILILFLTGLLVLPVRLRIETERNRYFIEIPIYFRAQLVPDNQLFFLKLRIFFIPFKISPFSSSNERTPKPKTRKKKKKERKNKMTMRQTKNMGRGFLRSFTIKKAEANIDTGDYPLNAQLIPVAQFINNKNIHLNINFENTNYADIDIFTRIYRIVGIVIKNKLINNKN